MVGTLADMKADLFDELDLKWLQFGIAGISIALQIFIESGLQPEDALGNVIMLKGRDAVIHEFVEEIGTWLPND